VLLLLSILNRPIHNIFCSFSEMFSSQGPWWDGFACLLWVLSVSASCWLKTHVPRMLQKFRCWNISFLRSFRFSCKPYFLSATVWSVRTIVLGSVSLHTLRPCLQSQSDAQSFVKGFRSSLLHFQGKVWISKSIGESITCDLLTGLCGQLRIGQNCQSPNVVMKVW